MRPLVALLWNPSVLPPFWCCGWAIVTFPVIKDQRKETSALVCFLNCNCTRNRSLTMLSIASTSHCLLSHPCTLLPRFFYKSFFLKERSQYRMCTFSLRIFYSYFFLTGPIPDALGKCIKLWLLDLRSNQLTGKCMIHHTKLLKCHLGFYNSFFSNSSNSRNTR